MNTVSKLIGISTLLFSANVLAECPLNQSAEEVIDCIRMEAANNSYCNEPEIFALEGRRFAVVPREAGYVAASE
jgi:hypothetical protein